MGISDRSLAWKYRRLWIPIRTFAGFDNNGTADISLSQGTPTLEPITTSEIAGLPMTTADEIAHILPIPWDMQVSQKVFGRIYFQHAAAGADAPVFKVTSKFFGKQDAMTEFIAGADVSKTFTAHTCSTNNPSLEVTKWEDLDWDDYITDTDLLAAISIELDALGSASADECKLLGFELGYEVNAMNRTHRSKAWQMVNDQPLRE
jgi:hypothetical protein